MKPLVFVFLVTSLLLAACGQPTQAPTNGPTEKPLFTDADIDKAQLITASEMKELIGIEGGMAPKGQDVPALPESTSELRTQATLPYVGGEVYYLRHDPNRLFGLPYSVFRHQQLKDKLDLIYSGEREIQSVAGTGFVFVVSMRETTDPASDFDIFLFYIYDPNNPEVYLLTGDTVPNTNVSMNFTTKYIVYEQPVAGKASVVLRTRQDYGRFVYDSVVLGHTDPQRQPSISQDGQYLTFVRDLSNGTDEVVKYSVATNTYLSVASSSTLLEDPSISWDG
jgi:hypothetical protein